MDRLFEFTANSTTISQDFYPPIRLDSRYKYAVGLLNLSTYHTIPNIRKDVNNIIEFQKNEKESIIRIEVPTGSYELDQLIDCITSKVKIRAADIDISFTLHKPTMTITMRSDKYNILFRRETPNLAKVFGFISDKYGKGASHVSEKIPQITNVNVINVECSIVDFGASYRNGESSQTIYSFYPDTPVGYKTVEQPANILFLPVNAHEISNITLRLTDQEGKLVDFRKELITVHLLLRRIYR